MKKAKPTKPLRNAAIANVTYALNYLNQILIRINRLFAHFMTQFFGGFVRIIPITPAPTLEFYKQPTVLDLD